MNSNNVYDFKADYLNYFSLASERLNSELVLVTNFGMIVCESYDLSVSPEDISLENASDPESVHKTLNIFNKSISEHRDEKSAKLSDDEKFIKGMYIKNVTLHTGGSPIKMPFLFVFFDQIVGVSFGNSLESQE